MSPKAERPMTTLAQPTLHSQTTEPRRGKGSSAVAMVGVITPTLDAYMAYMLVAALNPEAAAE